MFAQVIIDRFTRLLEFRFEDVCHQGQATTATRAGLSTAFDGGDRIQVLILNGGIDKEWDSYLKKMEQYGLSDYLAIKQKYFDQYQKSLSETEK